MSGTAPAKSTTRGRRGEVAGAPPRRPRSAVPARKTTPARKEGKPKETAGTAASAPPRGLEDVLAFAGLPIVEALNEGIVIRDRAGAVIAFNERASHILGVSTEHMAGADAEHPLATFVGEDGGPLDPSDLPTALSLRTGESHDGVVMGVRLANGAVRWISVNSAVLRREGEDEPFGAVGSFTDITEFKQALGDLNNERLKDLKRLATVAEYRDDDTGRHTERVARTAALIAMELGLERELIWTIARAAPLHDVGKVAIPDSVLLKPGRLTAEEFDVMKKHTTIGARILGDSDFPVIRMASEVALTHHERWDGSGYPAGLDGQSIPISGRIVSVADAFDAMAHSRPYKPALPLPEAIGEIEGGGGRQFDPEVVRAFLALDHAGLVEI